MRKKIKEISEILGKKGRYGEIIIIKRIRRIKKLDRINKLMTKKDILRKLKGLADPKVVERMAKFGITSKKIYGVSIPNLRKMAKETGTNHQLALELWDQGIRETRILASMVDDPALVIERQMEKWVKDFDSWEVCDQCCMNLFWQTPFAFEKAINWASRKEEFVKRAGFALMAVLAWKDKEAKNKDFTKFFPVVKKESLDERNFVKKAVNWALRQIGKRNSYLNKKAIGLAKEIQKIDSKTARWIASDAIKELKSEAIQKRLRNLK